LALENMIYWNSKWITWIG